MTPCTRYDDEWDLLLLGTLAPEAARAMRDHVEAGCPACGERWSEAAHLLSALGAGLAEVEPPLRVEQRLRQRLADASAGTAPTPLVSPERPGARWWKEMGLAAAVVFLLAGAVLALYNASLRGQLADVERRLESATTTLKRLETEASSVVRPEPVPSQAASSTAPPPPSGADRSEAQKDLARWGRERKDLEEAKARAESARTAAEEEVARLAGVLAAAERAMPSAMPAAALVAERQRVAGLQEALTRLTAQVERLEGDLRQRSDEAREYRAAAQAALDDRATRVTLRAVDPLAGQARASATLSPDGRLLLLARGLPPLPSDKCYQLWVIRRDDPAIVSAGVISVSGQGQALYSTRLPGSAARITGFALTDEPLGGSPAARGRKLLFGSVD